MSDPVAVPVGLPEGVPDAVGHALCGALPEVEADAPRVRDAVRDAVRVELPLSVLELVAVGVRVAVGVALPVGVSVPAGVLVAPLEREDVPNDEAEGVQEESAVEPAAQYCAHTQGAQAAGEDAPSAAEKVPAGHSWGLAVPARAVTGVIWQKEPAGQGVQAEKAAAPTVEL